MLVVLVNFYKKKFPGDCAPFRDRGFTSPDCKSWVLYLNDLYKKLKIEINFINELCILIKTKYIYIN